MLRSSLSPGTLDCRGRSLALGGGTLVVGILNITPDSFFDGKKWDGPDAACRQAMAMATDGAASIDVGGQSTRPGYAEITAEEETGRVLPVIERLTASLSLPLSIDTYKPAVARAAMEAGAHWINDIRGFQGDPGMARVAAEFGCPAVLMHHDRTFPEGREDCVDRLERYFARSVAIAETSGVTAGRLVLDPGIGFFKTPAQNLELLRRLGEIRAFGFPLLVGVSRKSILGHALADPVADRLEATLASTVLAVQQRVDFVRVHDVGPNVRAARAAGRHPGNPMMGRILLKNMAFYGYHGHHPEENKRGQRFFVDVALTLDIAGAAASDRLADTVDYGRAHDLCRRIVEEGKVKLLETLCQRLISALLEAFPRVSRVEVAVRKPSAPIPGVLDYVAVEASSERTGRLPGAGK